MSLDKTLTCELLSLECEMGEYQNHQSIPEYIRFGKKFSLLIRLCVCANEMKTQFNRSGIQRNCLPPDQYLCIYVVLYLASFFFFFFSSNVLICSGFTVLFTYAFEHVYVLVVCVHMLPHSPVVRGALLDGGSASRSCLSGPGGSRLIPAWATQSS